MYPGRPGRIAGMGLDRVSDQGGHREDRWLQGGVVDQSRATGAGWNNRVMSPNQGLTGRRKIVGACGVRRNTAPTEVQEDVFAETFKEFGIDSRRVSDSLKLKLVMRIVQWCGKDLTKIWEALNNFEQEMSDRFYVYEGKLTDGLEQHRTLYEETAQHLKVVVEPQISEMRQCMQEKIDECQRIQKRNGELDEERENVRRREEKLSGDILQAERDRETLRSCQARLLLVERELVSSKGHAKTLKNKLDVKNRAISERDRLIRRNERAARTAQREVDLCHKSALKVSREMAKLQKERRTATLQEEIANTGCSERLEELVRLLKQSVVDERMDRPAQITKLCSKQLKEINETIPVEKRAHEVFQETTSCRFEVLDGKYNEGDEKRMRERAEQEVRSREEKRRLSMQEEKQAEQMRHVEQERLMWESERGRKNEARIRLEETESRQKAEREEEQRRMFEEEMRRQVEGRQRMEGERRRAEYDEIHQRAEEGRRKRMDERRRLEEEKQRWDDETIRQRAEVKDKERFGLEARVREDKERAVEEVDRDQRGAIGREWQVSDVERWQQTRDGQLNVSSETGIQWRLRDGVWGKRELSKTHLMSLSLESEKVKKEIPFQRFDDFADEDDTASPSSDGRIDSSSSSSDDEEPTIVAEPSANQVPIPWVTNKLEFVKGSPTWMY